MKEEVKMEEGVAVQVKNEMQNTYSFLIDCQDAVDQCKVLEALQFDNGHIKVIKQSINRLTNNMPAILKNVEDVENSFFQLDNVGTNRLETVYDLSQDTYGDVIDSDTVVESGSEKTDSMGSKNNTETYRNDGSSNDRVTQDQVNNYYDSGSQNNSTSYDSGSQNNSTSYDTGSDSGNIDYSQNTNTDNYSVTNESTVTSPIDNTSQPIQDDIPFKFNFDINTAFKAGDIFANDKYSLTDFTNYILYKYNIKDENVANKIYMSVLRYGNNYYNKYQTNPIKAVAEKEILSNIYKDIGSIVANSNENSFWDILKDVKL